MYDSPSGRDGDSRQWIDDQGLMAACKQHTDLSVDDIEALLEVSHTLEVVHELEGGDIFIDCLSRDAKFAVVVAQFSPLEGTNYTRNIVGELMLRNNEPGVFRTLEIGTPSRKLKAVVSGDCLIRQNVSAIRNKRGKVVGVLIVERSIESAELWDMDGTEQQNAARGLFKEAYDANEMERVAEYMNDGMVRFNAQGIAVYANPRARQIYNGMEYMDEIVGLPFENLAFGNITFADVKTKGRNAHTEVRIGGYILNVVYAPINNGEKFTGTVLIIEDTTEEKNIEKELVLKSASIDEIHHRVKNNLQTIISLLRLQSRRIENEQARNAFAETISRIFSISLTHEILAQKGVDDVDIKEMLGRMLNSAKGYIVPENLELSLEIFGDSIELRSDTATSIAMVVNELVQNCIKHAFVGRSTGRVQLTITKGDVYSCIEVVDNGVGYSPGKIREGSLGHRLVRSLVEDKLFGKIEIQSSQEGTYVKFDFMNDYEKQRVKNKGDALRKMLEKELEVAVED